MVSSISIEYGLFVNNSISSIGTLTDIATPGQSEERESHY